MEWDGERIIEGRGIPERENKRNGDKEKKKRR